MRKKKVGEEGEKGNNLFFQKKIINKGEFIYIVSSLVSPLSGIRRSGTSFSKLERYTILESV